MIHRVVVLMPAPGHRHRIDRYVVGASDARGRFRFEHVPPGDYTVFASEDVESWSWFEPPFMQRAEPFGTPVQLIEGATASVVTTAIPMR